MTAQELLDAYDKALFDLLVVHGKVQMDTREDKTLHAKAVGTFAQHLAALRTARNEAGL